MFYVLSFLHSWFCGILVILISAFFAYDQFNIIDITSFAVLTFAGYLILFLFIYLLVLRMVTKKIAGRQALFYPLVFSLPANLPAYLIIWISAPELYGKVEATLFTLGFITIGLVFGTLWAWRNKVMAQGSTPRRQVE